MNATPELRVFDFQEVRRLAPAVLRALTQWQTEGCALASDAWTAAATYPLRVTVGRIEPLRTPAAVASLPEHATGVVFALGEEKLPALLAIDALRMQGLFADLLGSGDVPVAPVVELTPLEQSLQELLFQHLRESLADSWPGDAPLGCTIKEFCRPRRTRRLAASEEVIAVTWQVESRFHAGEIHWLFPRREIESLLSSFATSGSLVTNTPGDMAALVEQFPLDVSVELGNATVSTAAMTQLDIGDVLVLDQLLGLDVASALDLAETEGLLTTLAEPNLTALSGETASFLAGGEFPVPISQGQGEITVDYKQYGVSLAFTPVVLDNGRISMRVRPEVSELTSQGTVRLNGFDIPGVSTRRAETTARKPSASVFDIT